MGGRGVGDLDRIEESLETIIEEGIAWCKSIMTVRLRAPPGLLHSVT